MSAALVAKLAKSTDIDIAEAEKRWNQAKAITTEEKGLTDKDGDAFWQYVTGVFKRSMGIGAVMEDAGQEKARILAHGGATVQIPHVPPAKNGSGKSEGLSESREQEAGFSDPNLSKDGKPVKPVLESATADKKTALLNLLFEDRPEKFMTVIGGKYLVGAGKAKGTQNDGIFIVPGVVDRAVFREIMAEAATHNLSGKLTVYGERASYTGGNMRFRRLDEFAGTAAILESATSEEIHAAAHEAATSHLNDLPQPTQAQLEAGNYRKSDPIYIHGLKIVIENPKGSTRSGVDPDGTPWECVIPAHYGDLKQTIGADGDAFDVYVGDHPESELVFVVDQISADTGKFDEHKGILGCLSQKEARDLYIAGFSDGKGAKRLGAMTALHMPDFKKWLREGDTTKPLSDAVMESAEKAGPGQFFTLDEAREAAKRSPDYWKALIQDATTFDGIRGAFAAKWPEIFGASSPDTAIIRLTNNSDGGNVGAPTKEGAMKYQVEVTRSNVTVAEFFAAIKAACVKKGVDFGLDRDVFENPTHPSNDTYYVRDGIKYARYGDGEPTREYDGTDAAAQSETSRVKPYDYQTYVLNHDGSMFNEICEFTFDDGKRGHGYYYQASRDATEPEKTPDTTGLDAKYKEWEQSLNRKGAPTMQASRLTDSLLRSGLKREEFKVKTERGKDGSFGDAVVYGTMSAPIVEHTEALLRNGLNVYWYVPQGRDSITAQVTAGKEWHSTEAHLDWAGEAGTLSIMDVVKFDAREPGHTATFGPDEMDKARALVQAIQKPEPPAAPQKLKDVLPQEFFLEQMDTPAAKLLDVEVQKEGVGVWPGLHQNVHVWWQLTNGKAVGWNENPGKGWSFPVITFPSKV